MELSDRETKAVIVHNLMSLREIIELYPSTMKADIIERLDRIREIAETLE